LIRANFLAKKFTEWVFFCNFAAINNKNEDEKKYFSTDMRMHDGTDSTGPERQESPIGGG
jgi:hypothetical protein